MRLHVFPRKSAMPHKVYVEEATSSYSEKAFTYVHFWACSSVCLCTARDVCETSLFTCRQNSSTAHVFKLNKFNFHTKFISEQQTPISLKLRSFVAGTTVSIIGNIIRDVNKIVPRICTQILGSSLIIIGKRSSGTTICTQVTSKDTAQKWELCWMRPSGVSRHSFEKILPLMQNGTTHGADG